MVVIVVAIVAWKGSGGAEIDDPDDIVSAWRFDEAWESPPRALYASPQPQLVRRDQAIAVFWYARPCDTSPRIKVGVDDRDEVYVELDPRPSTGACDDEGVVYQATLELPGLDPSTPVYLITDWDERS